MTSMSGDMERIIIIIPSAFGQASSTSVRLPKSCCGIPLMDAAISERSSIIPTFLGSIFLQPEEIRRATSRSEEHTSELQSRFDIVCRLLLEKKNKRKLQ